MNFKSYFLILLVFKCLDVGENVPDCISGLPTSYLNRRLSFLSGVFGQILDSNFDVLL